MILESKHWFKQLVAEEGMFKGENYRYILKSSFISQKSGKLTIEPLSMDVDVQLPTNRRDVYRVVIVMM
jgi:hypothetical protein